MLLCAVQTTKIQNADAVQHQISHVNYIVWITIALTLNCIFHLQIHSYYPPKQQQQLSICKIKILYFHLISQSSWSNWESKLLGKFIKILWTDSFLQQKVNKKQGDVMELLLFMAKRSDSTDNKKMLTHMTSYLSISPEEEPLPLLMWGPGFVWCKNLDHPLINQITYKLEKDVDSCWQSIWLV